MKSRDYVDTVTAVAAYAWHVEILTNIYYMAAASNASESGDVLSEELRGIGTTVGVNHGGIYHRCGGASISSSLSIRRAEDAVPGF